MAFKKKRGKGGKKGRGERGIFGSKTAALNNITFLKVELGEKITKKPKTLQCQSFPRSAIHISPLIKSSNVCILHTH